jgi:hypothetical protein
MSWAAVGGSNPRVIPMPGGIAVTPRPLFDYRNMLVLTDEDLVAGPILDCPAGASPFGAQVRARGGDVVSVDPVYQLSRAEIMARVQRNLSGSPAWLSAHAPYIKWGYLGSVDAHIRAFEVAADLFAADYSPTKLF